MEFGRAFTYSFEDKDWLSKLVLMVIMVILSAIPFFGLFALAAILGYLTELVRNVRNGHPRPLPKWVDFGAKMGRGGYVLLAMSIYNLPALFLMVLTYGFGNLLGVSIFGSLTYVVIVCCALPVIFLYTIITWSMLAVALGRYSESGDNGEFYRLGKLFRTIQYNGSLTGQWVFYSIACNILLMLIGLIPCIGWFAAPALFYPVQGYLLGEYARMLATSDKAKREGAYR